MNGSLGGFKGPVRKSVLGGVRVVVYLRKQTKLRRLQMLEEEGAKAALWVRVEHGAVRHASAAGMLPGVRPRRDDIFRVFISERR